MCIRDSDVTDRFRQAMDDDLGTPAALAVVFDAVRDANRALDEGDSGRAATLTRTVASLTGALGLVLGRTQRPGGATDDDEVEALVVARSAAREAGDYDEADRLREELSSRGIVLEDSAQDTTWHRA